MRTPIQPRFIPPPFQDAVDAGRLILRDGTTAAVHAARADDEGALADLFRRLPVESTYRRSLSLSAPAQELVRRLCSLADPRSGVTLVVTRVVAGAARIVATGSYLARDASTAEVALAVDDDHQRRGLGTLLLERLALLAARNGFTAFWAVTSADNRPMLNVFRASGFPVREQPDGADIELTVSVTPSAATVAGRELRDRVATVASLRPFFQPSAVAVIGASRDPSSVGYRVLDGLIQAGFAGPIYPINPKANEIAGRTAYPSMREVPGPVDLAVIAVPARVVPAVVDDCAARGVRALVVISAGFAEVGGAGIEAQKALVDKVRGYGMRMVGPNCLGLLNTDPAVRLNASFSPVFPPPGRIAMSSQSGAVGLAALAFAKQYGLGFSTFVSVGNKADVSGNDLLQYWEEDPATDLILLYLESFGNPRRFARIARRVANRKTVVLLYSGRTKAGSRAAGSHTAALAASSAALDALFHQTGVIRAESMEEMFDLALALGAQPLPRGPRVGIVTNAGGPGILCADACEAAGLTAPEPSPELRAKLKELLPGAASVGNPIDLIAAAGPGAYRAAIEVVLASGEFDSVIVIYTPVGLAETGGINEAIAAGVAAGRAAGGAERPILACVLGADEAHAHLEFPTERVPCYPFPEAPARALGKAATRAAWRAKPPGEYPDFPDLDLPAARAVCRRAVTERCAGWLSAEEVRAVLTAVGVPLVPVEFARTPDEAAVAAGRLGFPVAVKLASRTLVHKSEVGGVRLGLKDASAVRTAFAEMRDRLQSENQPDAMDGVTVQPMVSVGVEVMIGVTQDPLFGPLVAFGLGGIHVEVLADVVFRAAPLSDRDAAEMVGGIRGVKLLDGYRGHPPADRPALEELLLRVSRLAEEVPEIGEIDFNPVFAFAPGAGCQVADARVQVRAAR